MEIYFKRLRNVKKILFLLYVAAVMGCAIGKKTYNYGFAFEADKDSVEILDFQYGETFKSLTNASTYLHPPQGIRVYMDMPKSNLRVKWRDLVNNVEYEQIMDKKNLPSNLEGKQIWFDIKVNVLQVYVIDLSKKHVLSKPDCGVKMYRFFECEQVFPNHTVNF